MFKIATVLAASLAYIASAQQDTAVGRNLSGNQVPDMITFCLQYNSEEYGDGAVEKCEEMALRYCADHIYDQDC